MKFCTKCGKKLNDKVRFCEECGIAVNPCISNTKPHRTGEKLNDFDILPVIIIISIIISLILFLIVSEFQAINNENKRKAEYNAEYKEAMRQYEEAVRQWEESTNKPQEIQINNETRVRRTERGWEVIGNR